MFVLEIKCSTKIEYRQIALQNIDRALTFCDFRQGYKNAASAVLRMSSNTLLRSCIDLCVEMSGLVVNTVRLVRVGFFGFALS